MKIGVVGFENIPFGKHTIKDNRLDLIAEFLKSHTKTYAYIEFVDESGLTESEVILVSENAKLELILKDLEFVESRLNRIETDSEKKLLNELKLALEKEAFLSELILTEEDKRQIADWPLLTHKPVFIITQDELQDLDTLIKQIIKDAGYIAFFTANEKEARAWLVKSSITAWEAAGKIHSDIQRGFIRAEVMGSEDILKAGSIHAAKQAGALQLVHKEYVLKDGDLIHFRFNV